MIRSNVAFKLVFGTMLAGVLGIFQSSEVLAASDVQIAQEVYSELQDSADGTAYVIVVLKPVPLHGAELQGQHQASVRRIQDRVLARVAAEEFCIVYQYKNFPALTGRVNAAGLAKLAVASDVVAVGPDALGEGHLNQSVPFINADQAHDLGYTGQGITVAVLDSGIDTDHPDLSDNIAPGAWHFLDQGADQGLGAEDDNGHGTNVSGIITSKGQVAPLGVAPDADILAVKVLKSDGSGWLSDWAAGVDYVVSVHGNYDNLCVINMSLGSWTLYSECPCDDVNVYNQALQAAILAAKNVGIATFASSGNQGSCSTMSSPACLSAAVAVAAVYDQNLGREPNGGTYQSNFGSSFADCYDATSGPDKITCFSNRSACNELAGPGRLITAPGRGGGTSTYTGTSQASPHCAGVAALMSEKASENCALFTPDEIVQRMKDTGNATDDPCGTYPNPIRVDAFAAISSIALKGDLNGNGVVEPGDIDSFVAVLVGTESDPDRIADMNCDDSTDGKDIQPFVETLIGG